MTEGKLPRIKTYEHIKEHCLENKEYKEYKENTTTLNAVVSTNANFE